MLKRVTIGASWEFKHWCPWCGVELKAAMAVDHESEIHPGCVMLCAACGEIFIALEFQDDGTLATRKFEDSDREEMEKSENGRKALELLEAVQQAAVLMMEQKGESDGPKEEPS